MFRRTDAAISPTALYTGTVWRRNGLSHPAFATFAGTALWTGLVGPRRAASLLGAPDLDTMLLARHHSIDTLLERAIDAGEISQVVEIAAGLSPRGWRFASRYGSDLTYIETDLLAMSRRKEDLLTRAELMGPGHRVRVLDAFKPTGPNSLDALANELDPDQGTAVITEGLINYFPMPHVTTLWNSVGSTLHRFPRGLYLSDLHLDQSPGAVTATAKVLITAFVRGNVYLHFDREQDAIDALRKAGFDDAELLLPSSFEGVDPVAGVDRNLIVRATTA
ncbi:class I SAM-dependent methyltransferase [Aeromicrobium sp.]|uniref:class I SAM-dependent methyltransferase n=1 Tax=Aeromicrobium sp. TaxID=1871063 RepID=UPI003D6C4CE9